MEKLLKSMDLEAFSLVSFQHLNTFDVRSKQRIPQNAKTVAAIIFPYYNKSAFCGNISAYCSVADYHIVVMAQLKSIISALEKAYPDNIFVPFVDSSPIDEVDLAVKGGLGVKGQNSLLITEKWGSFVFIGEIVTDLECDTVLYDYKSCMGCGLCRKNCPGGAIEECTAEGETAAGANSVKAESRYRVETNRCASFISQKKQELTEQQLEILSKAKTVFGCDICQKVCPHNKAVFEKDMEQNLFSGDILSTVTKENVAQIYRERAFGFRGLKVLERNLEIYEKQG